MAALHVPLNQDADFPIRRPLQMDAFAGVLINCTLFETFEYTHPHVTAG